MIMVESIGTDLPRVMAHVRDEILPLYDAIPAGAFGAMLIRRDLDAATKALAEGDVVGMIRCYQSLKEIKS